MDIVGVVSTFLYQIGSFHIKASSIPFHLIIRIYLASTFTCYIASFHVLKFYLVQFFTKYFMCWILSKFWKYVCIDMKRFLDFFFLTRRLKLSFLFSSWDICPWCRYFAFKTFFKDFRFGLTHSSCLGFKRKRIPPLKPYLRTSCLALHFNYTY